MHIGLAMSVYLSTSFISRNVDFDEIWYGFYAIGGHPNLILFNFLQLVITTWWVHKLLRWE
jgi:hypothetical protein